MKTMNRYVTALSAALLLAASATVASAAPTAVEADKMPAPARANLRVAIAKARSADAAAVTQVHAIAAAAREADLHARARKAPISLRLSALGPRAVLPLIDLLAFDAAPYAPNESAADRASVQRDLIEAIGLLKDARALPVLAVAVTRQGDFATMRTSAEALARLDSDAAAAALLGALAASSGEHTTALLSGMGACHRPVVARKLADRLGAHPDAAVARHLVKSLGSVGNAWAWQTLASRSDEAAVREAAATALVAGYVYYTGEVREAAAKALLAVSDAHTPALIAAARSGASSEIALSLDDLAARFAANPTR